MKTLAQKWKEVDLDVDAERQAALAEEEESRRKSEIIRACPHHTMVAYYRGVDQCRHPDRISSINDWKACVHTKCPALNFIRP